MNKGYIKVHRSLMDKYYYSKPDYLAVWIHMLLKANYKDKEILFRGKPLTIKRGQFITSRRQLSLETGVQEMKVERIIRCLKREQQIEQQGFNVFRLITITNYDKRQNSEQPDEQQMNSQRTASEQPVNTTNKRKKEKKEIKERTSRTLFGDDFQSIVEKWNTFARENDLAQIIELNPKRRTHLVARLKEKAFDFDAILKAIKESPFCMGENQQSWKITFDWVIKSTDYQKVLEGQYCNKKKSVTQAGLDWAKKQMEGKRMSEKYEVAVLGTYEPDEGLEEWLTKWRGDSLEEAKKVALEWERKGREVVIRDCGKEGKE